MTNKQRLALVSNRLPIVINKNGDGISLSQGSGGLVTALGPILRNRGGIWIGWPGTHEATPEELSPLLQKASKKEGFQFQPVYLTKEDVELYYEGFSNEIIWPLFHDLQGRCNFVPEYWTGYQNANAKFADAVVKNLQTQDFVWIHDYQLILLGKILKERNWQGPLAFFLHIPFPPLDIFIKLPWRFEIIRALLEFDLIGFQTMRDRRNFIQCVRMMLKDVRVENKKSLHHCLIGNRTVKVGSFPISIDFKQFSKKAELKETTGNERMIFSLDRLDYTKGIPDRLKAIQIFLNRYPEFQKKVRFAQVIIPSRTEIPLYQELKETIDRLVGQINSEFSKDGWIPIHHFFRSLSFDELLTYYQASEINLVTPVKDGMNLVCKEFIASSIKENGVLILSEFAGAASQLYNEALLVNPYDILNMAEKIHEALMMPEQERVRRMHKMRRIIKKYDIFWWVESFLNAAFQKELSDFTYLEDFIPEEKPI